MGSEVKFFDEITVQSAAEFLETLSPFADNFSSAQWIFRGHSDDNYQLVPNALRLSTLPKLKELANCKDLVKGQDQWLSWQIHMERTILREFFKLADRNGLYVPHAPSLRRNINSLFDLEAAISGQRTRWLPEDYLEIAALAQHYGLPTRLLDWSYDPFVAAFFACSSEGSDGFLSVWALNVALLSDQMKVVGGFPIEFVTPYYRGNPNLAAQKGVFTHVVCERPHFDETLRGPATPTNRTPLSTALIEHHEKSQRKTTHTVIKKIKLKVHMNDQLRILLRRANYSEASLFPGYGGIVADIHARAQR